MTRNRNYITDGLEILSNLCGVLPSDAATAVVYLYGSRKHDSKTLERFTLELAYMLHEIPALRLSFSNLTHSLDNLLSSRIVHKEHSKELENAVQDLVGAFNKAIKI